MKVFRLFAALMLAVVCVGLSSCSKDAENEIIDDNTLTLLVGNWQDDAEYYEVLTFNADKTWTGIYYYPNGTVEYQWGEGVYSYDSSARKLTLNNNISKSHIVEVLKITENELSYLSGGEIMNYTRQK